MEDLQPQPWFASRSTMTASGRLLALVSALVPRQRERVDSALSWSSEELLLDGDGYFARLVGDLCAARSQVSLEVYILADDEIGARVTEALADAAARGVGVRLMVDGIGSAAWIGARARALAARGVEVRVYHPPPWLIIRRLWARGPGRLSQAFRWFNSRNHRKVCLIDERVALVGSFNLERRHSRQLSGDRAWRDAAARVEGASTAILQRAFARAWRRAWRVSAVGATPSFAIAHRPIHVPASHLVRLNHGLRHRRRWRRELIERIGAARGKVWITSAYFVPDRRLLAALGAAAARGADVRLLVPASSDQWFMPLITRAYYQRLTGAGVRVHEFLPTFIHAKTMVVDGWAVVGSTNLNHRSLFHDLEADVVLAMPPSIAALEQDFRANLERSSEVTRERKSRFGWWIRMLGRLALRFRHWM